MSDEIYDYLAMNKDHFKDLCKDFITHLKECLKDEELKPFYNDIVHGFEETCKKVIAADLSKKFNVTFVDAFILIEDTNMREYLK